MLNKFRCMNCDKPITGKGLCDECYDKELSASEQQDVRRIHRLRGIEMLNEDDAHELMEDERKKGGKDGTP